MGRPKMSKATVPNPQPPENDGTSPTKAGVNRVRRAPPAFRRATVDAVTELSAEMLRVSVSGEEIVGFTVEDPASSIRVLVPKHGASQLQLPEWTGNEFLDEDGTRPALRTFTPLRVDQLQGTLEIEIVRHGEGMISTWAEGTAPGDPLAISGPARGYKIDPTARAFVLIGDASASPAIGQIVDLLEPRVSTEVVIDNDPKVLLDAARNATISDDTRVWAAGEAALVQAIRTHLFNERQIPRSQCTLRGYWKQR